MFKKTQIINKVEELINRLDSNKFRCRVCKEYKIKSSFADKSFDTKIYDTMYCICLNCYVNTSIREIDKALKNEY